LTFKTLPGKVCSPMVSKVSCTNKASAIAYFDKHLSTADYFIAADGPKQGLWLGNLAGIVGMDRAGITKADFEFFLSGDLTAVGVVADGEIPHENLKRVRESSLLYTEFAYTAPKGFSVAAALDDRLKPELMAAVSDELRWFETAAAVRDRRGLLHASGATTQPTGNFMAALFQHETSRTNDPNFHVHGLIGNMSYDARRKELLALHYGDMLELRKTLDARIHNNLAARAALLGYHVEVAANGFGLREVPSEAVEIFSVRHRQVAISKQLLQEGYQSGQLTAVIEKLRALGQPQQMENYAAMKLRLGNPLGSPVSERIADQTAVLLTRPPKEEITADDLRQNTLNKLKREGIAVQVPSPNAAPVRVEVEIKAVLDQALEHAFQFESVIRLDELIGEVARLAPGTIPNREISARLLTDERIIVGRMPIEGRENGVDLVTTAALAKQEIELLCDVKAGMGNRQARVEEDSYQSPATLMATTERIAEIIASATARGEELQPQQVATWLGQFAEIHRYVATSTDQFLNIRGGAGVGKTYCLELLVADSLAAERTVILAAPYGEQSRVTMRGEAVRLRADGKPAVAAAFETANTVAHVLAKAQVDDGFRNSLRRADIFVDEAGLLDTPTAANLIRLARAAGARVIFQGDTEQKLAVGRGAPLVALQQRLKLGMHVARASITRRQLKTEDKHLARDLSSGDAGKFSAALDRFIERGDLKEILPENAIMLAAKRIISARELTQDLLAFSSVHRIGDGISEEIHQAALLKNPDLKRATIDVLKPLSLAPAELLSSQSYFVGQTVAYRHQEKIRTAVVASVENGVVKIQAGSLRSKLNLTRVTEIFAKKTLERGVGAFLVATEKIQQGKMIYERNSRHRITKIAGEFITFDSGLKLGKTDGRLRQGDVLTVDKAQGAKGKHVIWIEDNRSLVAMGNRRDAHVGFTRHVEKLEVMVESIELFRETAQREREKFSALGLMEKATGTIWQLVETRAQKLPPPLPSSLSCSIRKNRSIKRTLPHPVGAMHASHAIRWALTQFQKLKSYKPLTLAHRRK
jgi:conjugative relaxase-like TrwC/TraI family protein